MITENELNEAIAEMQGQRRPDSTTCIKLASYYTIRNEMYPKKPQEQMAQTGYSNAAPTDYTSNTEFGQLVAGRDPVEVLSIIDGIMTDLYVINPPLYKRILREMQV